MPESPQITVDKNTNTGSGILVSVSCSKVVLRMQLHVFVLVKQYWQTIYN